MAKGVLLDEVWSSLLGRCLQRSGLEQIEGNDAEIGGNNAILGIQGFNGLVAVLGEDAGAFGETGDVARFKRRKRKLVGSDRRISCICRRTGAAIIRIAPCVNRIIRFQCRKRAIGRSNRRKC